MNCTDCGAKVPAANEWCEVELCDRCFEALSWRKLQESEYVLVERSSLGTVSLIVNDSDEKRIMNMTLMNRNPRSAAEAALVEMFPDSPDTIRPEFAEKVEELRNTHLDLAASAGSGVGKLVAVAMITSGGDAEKALEMLVSYRENVRFGGRADFDAPALAALAIREALNDGIES